MPIFSNEKLAPRSEEGAFGALINVTDLWRHGVSTAARVCVIHKLPTCCDCVCVRARVCACVCVYVRVRVRACVLCVCVRARVRLLELVLRC